MDEKTATQSDTNHVVNVTLIEPIKTIFCVVVVATNRDCHNHPDLARRLMCKMVYKSISFHNLFLFQTVHDTRNLYSTTLQQTLMLVLIVGRWLLPRGELTRDELSQLLLVYIGMAADMLEYSIETLRVEQIACDPPIFYAVIAVWSWSLTQFTLGLTSTRSRRAAGKMKETKNDENNAPVPDEIYSPATSIDSLELSKFQNVKLTLLATGVCGTELWALIISLLIQDGPYLVTRLYIMIHFRVFDHSMIFFTCKNALLLVIVFYRLFVVINKTRRKNKRKLHHFQDRTQPAGHGRFETTSTLRRAISNRKYRTRKEAKHHMGSIINVQNDAQNTRMNSSEPAKYNDIYQVPPNVEADDDDDSGEVKKGAYVVTGNENSIDLSTMGRPPTPPPFPLSPLKASAPVSSRESSPARVAERPVPVRKDHAHFSSDLADASQHRDFSSTSIYAAVRRKTTQTS